MKRLGQIGLLVTLMVSMLAGSAFALPANPPSLKEGDSGTAVRVARILLKPSCDALGETQFDFGGVMTYCTKYFQRTHGIGDTGQIGPITWRALLPMVRYGSSGRSVRALQVALNAKGYGLAVDGIFGRGTQWAVMNFQSRQGLQVDGIVGPRTWAALLTAVQQSGGSHGGTQATR